jgi:hypothetical protein
MYQSFQTINAALPEAVRTNIARAVIQAQSSADAVVATATSVISSYSSLYNQVQQVKYGTDSTIEDITSAERLTIPQSAVSLMKQSMNELDQLITWYASMPDKLTVNAKGSAVVNDGVADGLLVRSDAVNFLYASGKVLGGIEYYSTIKTITLVEVDAEQGDIVPHFGIMHQVAENQTNWEFFDPDRLPSCAHLDVLRKDTATSSIFVDVKVDLTASDPASQFVNPNTTNKPLDQLLFSDISATPSAMDVPVITRASEVIPNGDIVATFDIPQLLNAVVAPYRSLITAIKNL